jgi:hypothetical protein
MTIRSFDDGDGLAGVIWMESHSDHLERPALPVETIAVAEALGLAHLEAEFRA